MVLHVYSLRLALFVALNAAGCHSISDSRTTFELVLISNSTCLFLVLFLSFFFFFYKNIIQSESRMTYAWSRNLFFFFFFYRSSTNISWSSESLPFQRIQVNKHFWCKPSHISIPRLVFWGKKIDFVFQKQKKNYCYTLQILGSQWPCIKSTGNKTSQKRLFRQDAMRQTLNLRMLWESSGRAQAAGDHKSLVQAMSTPESDLK